MSTTLSDTNTASVRTGWQAGVFTALVALLYKLTGWKIELEDLLPFAPVAAVAAGIFYRISRVISDKLPWIGYVLFGNRKTPSAYVSPAPANDPVVDPPQE